MKQQGDLLIVDDEEYILKALERTLVDEDYQVELAISGEEGLQRLARTDFKVVVSDERMPGMSGADFLHLVSLRHPEVVRIMLTGHASVEAAMKVVNSGQIYRFLAKPWNDLELKLSIRSALDKYAMEMENRRLLALVRTQAQRFKLLERQHPGITDAERGADGSFVLPELSDEEMAEILDACQIKLER